MAPSRRSSILLSAVAAAALATGALAGSEDAHGRISIKAEGGIVAVEGLATATDAGTYEVALSAMKTGTAGRANTRQKNAFTLAKGETVSVGRMSFNMMRGDTLAVTIEILRDGEIVSNSSSVVSY